jgi:hypothetical protein
MVSTLKIEDRLEGTTNFRAWKAKDSSSLGGE